MRLWAGGWPGLSYKARVGFGDHRGGAEQDEAAEDNGDIVAPVHAARQHHEADARYRDHRDDRRHLAPQPAHRANQRGRAGGVREGVMGVG